MLKSKIHNYDNAKDKVITCKLHNKVIHNHGTESITNQMPK